MSNKIKIQKIIININRPPNLLSCAREETLTILAGLLSMILGNSNNVKRNGPRWLVPNCVSNPSTVLPWGVIITPALLISKSILRSVSRRCLAHFLTDWRLERSSSATTSSPRSAFSPHLDFMSATASLAF